MPDACPTCTKPAHQLAQWRALRHWECAHIACPSRRRCWSEQVAAPVRAAVLPQPSGLAGLFDNVRAVAARGEGMAAVSAPKRPVRAANQTKRESC